MSLSATLSVRADDTRIPLVDPTAAPTGDPAIVDFDDPVDLLEKDLVSQDGEHI